MTCMRTLRIGLFLAALTLILLTTLSPSTCADAFQLTSKSKVRHSKKSKLATQLQVQHQFQPQLQHELQLQVQQKEKMFSKGF